MYKLSLLALLLVAAEPEPKFNERPTLHGVTEQHKELSILEELYRKTEMKFKIEQSRDATVFMPVNSAFNEFDTNSLTYPQLIRIFNYLSLGRVVILGELKLGDHSLETIEGSHLNVTISEDEDHHKRFEINKIAHVIEEPQETMNGIAYLIDKIVIPPGLQEDLDEEKKASSPKADAPSDEHRTDSALENLQVPAHIEASNRENNRYDLTPAKTTTTTTSLPTTRQPTGASSTRVSGSTTTTGTAHGVITKANRRMSQLLREQNFLPARARGTAKANVVYVGKKTADGLI